MEDQNELVTKKVFSAGMENLTQQISGLAVMVQKGFEEAAENLEAFKAEVNVRITALEATMEKEVKSLHNLIDAIFQELENIRKQLAQADTRAEVIDLEIRVNKIEKKLRFKV